MAISRNMMERQLRAGGGIMTLDEPRQGYFLGKIVKKAKRAVKKVVKSPLGKLALGAAAANFAPMLFGKPTLLKSFGSSSGLGGLLSKVKSGKGFLGQIGNVFRQGGDKDNPFSIFRLAGGAAGLGALAAPFLMGGDDEEIDPGIDVSGVQPMVAGIRDQARMFYTDPASRADSGLYFMPQQKFVRPFAGGGLADIPRGGYSEGESVIDLSKDPNYKGWLKLYEKNPDAAEMNENHAEYLSYYNSSKNKKAEGGIMDLGGMEKDYREGGFVPIGAEERADDVPARLSKNEFVFTADAVRNAGGGDIDKGAEVMQNMMDNLEAGGMISEESQGKENPAQAMFDQAQMLENRIV